jgi:hypothetical protein
LSRAACTLLLAGLLALATGGTANAGIWTPIASGTTENITALDYQGGDRFWIATAGGSIRYREGGVFKPATGTGLPTSIVFNDIAFQPGSNVGLAVGNGNNVWRSTDAGRTWSKLAPTTIINDFCGNVGGGAVPVGDMFAIAWGANDVVYLGGDHGTVLRSQDGGASFTEVNKSTTGCRMDSEGTSDMFFFPSSTSRNDEKLYFQAREAFGQIFFTSDGLQSSAQPRDTSINGTEDNTNLAVDPTNTNRIWSTNNCGFTCFYRSEDGAANFECVCTILNEGGEDQLAWTDVEYTGGTTLVAGEGGQIAHSVNGRDFFYNKADGSLLTKDWLAAGLASGTAGAVGGQGGALVVTSAANATPDIIKPTGTISGPTTVKSGRATSYTLNVADEGGSGINAGSFRWSSPGLPGATGRTVQLTFPNPGFFTVTVTFADNAGNTGEATLSVTVEKGSNALPVSFTGPGNTLSAKIKGRFIRVTMKGTITLPAGATAAACSKKITLRIKKKQRVMAHRKAKLRYKASTSRCTFAKKIKLRRKKVGKTKKLRLTVSHPGNSVLRKSSKKLTLVIKK